LALSDGVISDTAILKKLTGRQASYVEDKNVKGGNANIHAKLWISANKMLQILNATDADYRRFIPVALPNQFDEIADPKTGVLQLDPDLQDNITTDEELAGIFNVMMIAIRRVLKNKKIFLHDNTIKKRREKFELSTNPVKAFIEAAFVPAEEIEELESENEQYVKKETVFDAYQLFRRDNKLAITSPDSLYKALKAEGFKDKKITLPANEDNNKTKRYHCYVHKTLKKEWLDRLLGKQETLA